MKKRQIVQDPKSLQMLEIWSCAVSNGPPWSEQSTWYRSHPWKVTLSGLWKLLYTFLKSKQFSSFFPLYIYKKCSHENLLLKFRPRQGHAAGIAVITSGRCLQVPLLSSPISVYPAAKGYAKLNTGLCAQHSPAPPDAEFVDHTSQCRRSSSKNHYAGLPVLILRFV